ncbi:MAG: hypothetical protein H7Z17_16625 [Fuerstia sp.]|nr:hypothetical protein [Fuerstiella sp.]
MSIDAKKMLLSPAVLLNISVYQFACPFKKHSETRDVFFRSAFFRELAQRLPFVATTEADDGVVGPGVRENSAGV